MVNPPIWTTSNRPSGVSRTSSGASNRFRITPVSIPHLPVSNDAAQSPGKRAVRVLLSTDTRRNVGWHPDCNGLGQLVAVPTTAME